MFTLERIWKCVMKPWVSLLCLVVLILCYQYLDRSVAYYFHAQNIEMRFPIIHWLTKLGLGGLYYVSLFGIALYYRYGRPNKRFEMRAWFLWYATLIPGLVCLVLKIILGRARPALLFQDHVYGFFGLKWHAPYWSCPSGHTSTIMGFAFGLCAVFPRHCYAWIVAGLALSSTRIVLTNHYVSDVLFAAYLALIEIGLLQWWLKRRKQLQYAFE